ncbi:MAG: hypothetical protein WAM82_23930 [Thermoanaerobaculia bacterium]
MNLDFLYILVTEAIRRAETLEDLRAPGVHTAYSEVSLLEEKVAELLPASNPEGALARRGAVRAALAAREFGRAQRLAERFLAEADADAESKARLRGLFEEREHSTVLRFPRVAATVGMSEVRRLARALVEQGAPFPIG